MTCEVSDHPIRVSYPVKDVERISRTRKCEYIRFQELKHSLSKVRKERAKQKPFTQNTNPFSAPFDVFYGDIDDRIPLYLLDEPPPPEKEFRSGKLASTVKTPPSTARSQSVRRANDSPALPLSARTTVKTVVREFSFDDASDRSIESETDQPDELDSASFSPDSESADEPPVVSPSTRKTVTATPPTRSTATPLPRSTPDSAQSDVKSAVFWRKAKSPVKVPPVEWKFTIPLSTEIDDGPVLDRLNQLHSVESLLAALRAGGGSSRRSHRGPK
jgi:hypothetical protein